MATLASRQEASARSFSTVVPLHDLKEHCAACNVRESCLATGVDADTMRDLELMVHHRIRVKKRDSLYRPGEPFASIYAVRLGTFKTVLLAEDGREQVTGYHMAGDILGLDGIGEGRHACQAVALEDSAVCVIQLMQLDELAHRVPRMQRNLYRMIGRDIGHARKMMFMLGSTRAEERLASFLLNLAQRYQVRGYSPNEFMLRMTREETASYLGLKLETVSRLFSRLQEEGLLQVEGRMIKLLDLPALTRMTGHESSRPAD
jgi:CRP/FNR family transcriptional regulator